MQSRDLDTLIDELESLQSEIAAAVAASDWPAAATLCESRQKALATAFAAQPVTLAQFRRLRDIAERVMESDAALLATVADVRRETAEALKTIGTGRRATRAYHGDSG